MSSFAWLDFSDFDRRRTLEVIQRLSEHDTVDELGIGSVRDGISEVLFPATSVIHTRARYFFFIPWIYQRLEKRGVTGEKFGFEARKAELRLIEVLLASEDSDGTIGSRARQGLKILPSAIYWQALHRLGIRTFPGTRDRYHKTIDRFYATRKIALKNDDGELEDRFRDSNWDKRLPAPPEDFPTSASLALRAVEAEYLKERIIFSGPQTLYRHLVDSEKLVSDCEYPWEVAGFRQLPERIQNQLDHARNFSQTIHSASLVYNLILSRLEGYEDSVAEYSESLDQWADEHASREKAIREWNLSRFWEVAAAGGSRISPQTRLFVESWISLVRETHGKRLSSNLSAQRMIEDRERQLKRGQARVDSKRAREIWRGESGLRQLTYRWGIAHQTIVDIQSGLAN